MSQPGMLAISLGQRITPELEAHISQMNHEQQVAMVGRLLQQVSNDNWAEMEWHLRRCFAWPEYFEHVPIVGQSGERRSRA